MDASGASLKRRTADDSPSTAAAQEETPAKIHRIVEGPRETFNPILLKFYYQHLFPFRQMFRWLAHGHDPSSSAFGNIPDFFLRRELTFNLPGDVYVRYLCFKDAESFQKSVCDRQPERIEIGPVYTAAPDRNKTLKKDVFKPVERELIFDIDMNDYDDIRTCCSGANVCKKCWSFVNVAVRVLDTTLRNDFGFRHIMFVFSGRRGMHAWVSDDAARKLTDEQRSAILDYVNVFSKDAGSRDEGIGGGGGGSASAAGGGASAKEGAHRVQFNRVMNSLTTPLHPSFQRAYADLEPFCERSVFSKTGQGLLERPEQYLKILDLLPEVPDVDLRGVMEQAWTKDDMTAERRWATLKSTIQGIITRAGGPSHLHGMAKDKSERLSSALRRTLDKFLPALVFTYCYARLDVEVSKHRNHLLKAPFCIHPKTGKICVPIDPKNVERFDPNEVPTVAVLMDETSSWLKSHAAKPAGVAADEERADAWKHTSLKPYISFFENHIAEINVSLMKARRDAAEKAAAQTGEW